MFYSYFPSSRASTAQLLVTDQTPGVPVGGIMEYLSWLPAAILFGAVIPRIADNMINCAGICIFVPKVHMEALLRDYFAFSEQNKMCKARVREDVMEIKLKQEWSCKAAERNFWICLKNNPLPRPQISHQHPLPCRSTCLFKVMPAQALSWVGTQT